MAGGNVQPWDISLEHLDGLGGYDSLCLFVGEDERPLRGAAGFVDWRMCGQLSRVLRNQFFTGKEGDTLLLPSGGRFPSGRIFVIGLGPTKKLDAAALGRVLEKAAQTLVKAKVEAVAGELPGEGLLEDGVRAGALRSQFLPQLGKAKVAVLGGKPLQRLLAG